MNIWWIIILLWLMFSLGGVMEKHGEPKRGKYSFGDSFLANLIFLFLIYKAIVTGF